MEKINFVLVNLDVYWLFGNICEVEYRLEEEILVYKKVLVYCFGYLEISVILVLVLIEVNKNEEGFVIFDWMLEEGYEYFFIYNNCVFGLL